MAKSVVGCLAFSASAVYGAPSEFAAPLLAQRTLYQSQLRAKQWGEPLHLVSRESADRLEGDVYADLAVPFARLRSVLTSPDSLCGMLFLHLNVRACKAQGGATQALVTMAVGPKQGASPDAMYSMAYKMRAQVDADDHVVVTLTAANGPLSTHNYRMVVEATPLDAKRSFLHFSYGYSFGALSKMAMGVYLATAGRNKLGFTVTGTGPDGKPQFIQGERGSLERNVMRNYFALQAYANVADSTTPAATDARLRAWFALTERHADQLHEFSLEEYLQEKHDDLARTLARMP